MTRKFYSRVGRPRRTGKPVGRPAIYPWATMAVGETFVHPDKPHRVHRRHYEVRTGRTFRTSRLPRGTLVERVA